MADDRLGAAAERDVGLGERHPVSRLAGPGENFERVGDVGAVLVVDGDVPHPVVVAGRERGPVREVLAESPDEEAAGDLQSRPLPPLGHPGDGVGGRDLSDGHGDGAARLRVDMAVALLQVEFGLARHPVIQLQEGGQLVGQVAGAGGGQRDRVLQQNASDEVHGIVLDLLDDLVDEPVGLGGVGVQRSDEAVAG